MCICLFPRARGLLAWAINLYKMLSELPNVFKGAIIQKCLHVQIVLPKSKMIHA
jgi:hypothetical protein